MDNAPSSRIKLTDLIGIFATGVLCGALVGAVSNLVNGVVSPFYFVTVLGWEDITNIWRASIARGVFEGIMSGLFLSLIFSSVVGIITRATCSYRLGLRYLIGIGLGALLCWCAGGLLGIMLASLSPEFYGSTSGGAPSETVEMLKYAWVDGSIRGAHLGGVLSVVLALVLFRARWSNETL